MGSEIFDLTGSRLSLAGLASSTSEKSEDDVGERTGA